MKKIHKTIIVSALLLTAATTGIFAAGQRGACIPKNSGVCLNQNCQFIDADGDGYCDNMGQNCRFVDENGDGICDNFGTGLGSRSGGHHGRGTCRNQ